MDTIEIIMYVITLLIVFTVIGLGAYITYDYISYKKNLNIALKLSTADINSNFYISSSNLENIYNTTNINITDIETNSNLLASLSQYSSNVLTNRINNADTNFLNFNNNLNKYFSFNDGNSNISSPNNNPNNKIFNYIFGTNTPNMNLITKTTAFSGITMNTDINKELIICNSNINNKCIKMMTDANGSFYITPSGTNNIYFNNNLGNKMLNIDTLNSSMYLGGDTSSNSAMYINNSNVYVKNLNIVDDIGTISSTINNTIVNASSSLVVSGYNSFLNSKDEFINNFIDTMTIIENKISSTNINSSIIKIKVVFPNDIYVLSGKILTIDVKNMIKLSILTDPQYKIYKALDNITATDTKYIYYLLNNIDNQNNILLKTEDLNNNILSFTISPILSTTVPPLKISAKTEFNIVIVSDNVNLTKLPDTFTGIIQGYSGIVNTTV